MTLTLDRIDDLEQDLKSRAFLYDDPTTFRAAIGLAMTMLRESARAEPADLDIEPADLDIRDERAVRPSLRAAHPVR